MLDFFKQMARILSHIQLNANGQLQLDLIVNIQDPDGGYLLFTPTDTTTV